MTQIYYNKEASHSFEFLATYQAGIVLSGAEVKAVKLGQISLKGAYATIDRQNEVWLAGAHISPYRPASGQQKDYDPDRRRKLLLNKKEIAQLVGQGKQKGLTIVPISVYTKRGLIKVDIALARGKTAIDKRETIKKRQARRDIERAMKGGR